MLNVANAVAHDCVGPHRKKRTTEETCRKSIIMAWPVAAREGALIGYGPDYVDMFRRVGAYIHRIIKGEKPADLPVQEPTKFPLLINAKSAKAIGITFPPALVVAADEVID